MFDSCWMKFLLERAIFWLLGEKVTLNMIMEYQLYYNTLLFNIFL